MINELGEDIICPKFNKYCACIECHTIGYCIDNPCEICDGPVEKRCPLPDDYPKD